MKTLRTKLSIRDLLLGCACALFLLGLKTSVVAQTSLYDASYDSSGNEVTNATAVTLNPFTVTGIYQYNTQITVFVTDGTANARIFGYASGTGAYFTTLPTVGAQYTGMVTASPYQGTQELKATGTLTANGMFAAVTAANVTLSQIANSATIGVSPSAANYAATSNLLFAPVTFTITPNASGTLSTTTTTNLTDTATNLQVSLYRSASAVAYTAGQALTLTGYEQPFANSTTGGNSEIVGAFVPVPEPSTYALCGLGGVALAAMARRRGGRRAPGGIR